MTSSGEGGDDDPPGDLMLDACQVLNLYATRRMPEVLASLERAVTITELTLTTEAQWVGAGRRADENSDVEQVDLEPMIATGLLHVARVETENEADWFVRLASVMDDGEAMAGAIAISRRMELGTDDRRAIAVFSSLSPPLLTISTATLLRSWAESANVSSTILADVLRSVRERARFSPSPTDPLFDWWKSATA